MGERSSKPRWRPNWVVKSDSWGNSLSAKQFTDFSPTCQKQIQNIRTVSHCHFKNPRLQNQVIKRNGGAKVLPPQTILPAAGGNFLRFVGLF